MEVTQVAKHVTHAVIGQHAAMESGISESAEFYQMLSQSLYRNPKLAMIREVICNQLDAHIMGDVTRPPEIIITSDKITFRDFGPGIPHDKIHEIYNVYGNSTKKKDSRATGGFGLGCKSPYAYTDHFTVISHNSGTKSVYQMAKSSGEVQGKPSMTLLFQIPTTETGVEVSIDIKSHQDFLEFKDYISDVVNNSGKKVMVNGIILDHIDYSNCPHGYILTRTLSVMDRSINIHLKYGDVVYPLTEDISYGDAFASASKILRTLNSQLSASTMYRLVLLMEPNSITIAPSRENITIDPFTSKNINEKLKDLIENYNEDITKFYPDLAIENYENFVEMSSTQYSFNKNNQLITMCLTRPNRLFYLGVSDLNTVKDSRDFARLVATHHIPANISEKAKNQILNRYMPDRVHPYMRGLVPKLLKEMESGPTLFDKSKFVIEHVLPIVLRKLKTLDVWLSCESSSYRRYGENSDLIPVKKLKPENKQSYRDNLSTSEFVSLLHFPVVLGRLTKNRETRAYNVFTEKFKMNSGWTACYWFIQAPADKKELEAVRKTLEESGMHFVDLTVLSPEEERLKKLKAEQKLHEKITKPESKKADSYPSLSSAASVSNTYNPFDTHRIKDYPSKIVWVDKPEMFIKVSFRGNMGMTSLPDVPDIYLMKFVEKFGVKCAVISTASEEAKLTKLGAVPMKLWLTRHYRQLFRNNRVRQSIAWDDTSLQRHHIKQMKPNSDLVFVASTQSKIAAIQDNESKWLSRSFCFNLPPEQELLLNMFYYQVKTTRINRYLSDKDMTTLSHLVRNRPKLVTNFQKSLLDNQLLPYLDVNNLINATMLGDTKACNVYNHLVGKR